MPLSKKRKAQVSRRPKKRGPKLPLEDINGVIRIKPNVFAKIRDDEDFANMVRIGRLLNVLSYMADSFISAPLIDDSNPLSHRRFVRDMFNIAGYVYEGYLLIENIYPKYRLEPFFSRFAKVYEDPDKPRKKRILRLMRNAGAFHLDNDNTSTKKALSKLDLKKIDLVSGSDGTFSTLYFHLSDTVDINYVIDELKKPGDAETDIYTEMGKLSADLLAEFSFGADELISGLLRKLNLSV